MPVNAVILLVLFVTLMVGSLLSCYLVAVHRGDVQAWIPYIRYILIFCCATRLIRQDNINRVCYSTTCVDTKTIQTGYGTERSFRS